MKQNKFEILLAKIDEVNTKIDGVKTGIQEINAILMKHDDAMVEHGWLSKFSFKLINYFSPNFFLLLNH